MSQGNQQFEDHVLANLDEAEGQIGYHFKGLREMIDKFGAVGAAKMLVDLNSVLKPHDGFQVLSANDRESLSIEQAVIDFADSGLFTAAEVQSAKSRLLIFKRKKQRNRGEVAGA
jgi:hypothetical protein